MKKRKYYNSFCEICGKVGNVPNPDGCFTCVEHMDTPRPPKPLFKWNTGEPVGEDEILDRPWLTPDDEDSL